MMMGGVSRCVHVMMGEVTTVNSRYSGHPWGKVKWLD